MKMSALAKWRFPHSDTLQRVLATMVVAVTITGCHASSKSAIEGIVTLNGTPLSEGDISFRPLAGTESPTVGAHVSDGHFSIPQSLGLKPGRYSVVLNASRKTGRKIVDPSGHERDEIESLIPARYNQQTELTADVTADAVNRFEFILQSP
jgi:hypothetical protein